MRAKVCKSRKSTHTIMSNGGFGQLKVIIEGVEFDIPKQLMFKDGTLKKYAIKYINKHVKEIKEMHAAINNAC